MKFEKDCDVTVNCSVVSAELIEGNAEPHHHKVEELEALVMAPKCCIRRD